MEVCYLIVANVLIFSKLSLPFSQIKFYIKRSPQTAQESSGKRNFSENTPYRYRKSRCGWQEIINIYNLQIFFSLNISFHIESSVKSPLYFDPDLGRWLSLPCAPQGGGLPAACSSSAFRVICMWGIGASGGRARATRGPCRTACWPCASSGSPLTSTTEATARKL